jgi:protein-tyrosine kinase
MERIRRAVELAKAAGSPGLATEHREPPRQPLIEPPPNRLDGNPPTLAALNPAHLEANRIIAHDRSDQRSRSYDMLRTQVLQAMDVKSWQLLAVTSPKQGCGKTLTSINLALSIARQPESSVLLVDMDLEKPQVANCLGIKCKRGLLGVLAGHTMLQDAFVETSIAGHRLTVLPCEASTTHASEYMTSSAMSAMLQAIKRENPSRVVIFDLPPMLSGDNVISILPQMDCVLFVVAVGTTTASEIKECEKHLQTSAIVRVVLNKASEHGPAYY